MDEPDDPTADLGRRLAHGATLAAFVGFGVGSLVVGVLALTAPDGAEGQYVEPLALGLLACLLAGCRLAAGRRRG